MDRILIRGGKRLSGKIPVSGAKNAALTLMPCALLTDEPLTLRNLPRLADVDSFGHLLNELGASTSIEGTRPSDFGRVMTVRAGKLTSTVAPYDIVRKMRASILVLGPLLGRAGEATVSLPGGCAIGNRPIDLHLKVLEAIGAEIEVTAGYVKASAPGGRLGRALQFPGGLGRRDGECADGGGDLPRAPPCSTMRHASPRSSTCAICSSRWVRISAASAPSDWRSRASTACTAQPIA
jgi:UDP-N-acetylglucosamine 1-carboxyvinyltransferase